MPVTKTREISGAAGVTTAPPCALFMGLYAGDATSRNLEYRTRLSAQDSFPTEMPGNDSFRLVCSRPLPEELSSDMYEHLIRKYRRDAPEVPVGKMSIKISTRHGLIKRTKKRIAQTVNYLPKLHLATIKMAPGLGYFTEEMVLSHLGSRITHVTTTRDPSLQRRNQIQKAGLKIKKPVPVDKWREGIREGLQASLRKAHNGETSWHTYL